jgi:hypothetical protein
MLPKGLGLPSRKFLFSYTPHNPSFPPSCDGSQDWKALTLGAGQEQGQSLKPEEARTLTVPLQGQ